MLPLPRLLRRADPPVPGREARALSERPPPTKDEDLEVLLNRIPPASMPPLASAMEALDGKERHRLGYPRPASCSALG